MLVGRGRQTEQLGVDQCDVNGMRVLLNYLCANASTTCSRDRPREFRRQLLQVVKSISTNLCSTRTLGEGRRPYSLTWIIILH